MLFDHQTLQAPITFVADHSTSRKLGFCRGIVTADVLELGLSRGAIATRKLEGVNAGQGTRGFILVRPLTVKVKAYVQLRWYYLGFR